jgi:glycosyltransferase involved in cell wall biosynthesis
MSGPVTIVIEGWRHIPHSYAMCTQQIELELLRRGEAVRLFHTDMPYANPQWRPEGNLFPPDDVRLLAAIPGRPAGLKPDAVIRMGWPHWFHPDPSGCPVFVWGTTEFKRLAPESVGSRRSPSSELAATACEIIATSRWAGAGFINSGARRDRVHVVPAGVDTSVMKPVSAERRAELRRQLGWEGSFILLNISAMTGNKGIPRLLHAAGVVSDRVPNLRVMLKGSDTLYNSQMLAAQMFQMVPPAIAAKVQPRIGYLGQTLSSEQIATMYQAADLYVSPYSAEGFNMPALEAAACGLPVITTIGGSTDDFTDASWCRGIRSKEVPFRDGFGLEPDVGHLMELIATAAVDPAWLMSAREAGPTWVRERYTWGAVADQILGLVRRAGSGAAES